MAAIDRSWWLAQTLAAVCGGVAMYIALRDLRAVGLAATALAPFLVLVVLVFSVALHELGHALAARLCGMRVLRIHVAGLEAMRRHDRWRWRWRPNFLSYAGFVFAVADLSRPLRRQYLCLTAGGPLLHLVIALAAALVAVQVDSAPARAVSGTVLWIQLGLLLANLVPFARPIPSDGQRLVQYWRGVSVDSLEVTLARLVHGATASELAPASLEAMVNGPLTTSLTAQWLQLKSAQERSQWRDAIAIGEGIAQRVAEAGAAAQRVLATLAESVRLETAFNRALLEASARPLVDVHASADLHWLSPHLLPRLEALRHRLQGNVLASELALDLAADAAEHSIDAGLRRSEALLHDAIRRLPRAAAA
jgi:hypothetical protein